jgi:hypothetical protein
VRYVSAVIIIEKWTGDTVWKIGSEFLAPQRHAIELENGNILIFDNGTFGAGESITCARAVNISRATKKISWGYRDRF